MNRVVGKSGFTLLEVLVAATLTLLIAGVMVSVSMGVLDAWRRTQAAHTQAAAARQIFDQLAQDLQAACRRPDSHGWLAVEILDSAPELANHGWLVGPGLMKPSNGRSLRPLPAGGPDAPERIADARFGLSGCWLRFVTANGEAGGTLPAVVAYALARRPVTGDPVPGNRAPVRYSLYRSAIDATVTLAAGYTVSATPYASADNRPFAALSSAYREARNVMNPSHANLLAAHVVDFGVWLYVREPTGNLRRIFPATAADRRHLALGNGTADDVRYPEVADVSVRILTEEGATLLEAMENGRGPVRPATANTDADWWWAVVEAHSRVYSQRIALTGAGR